MNDHKYLQPGYWAQDAVDAWIVTHPDSNEAGLWAIVPGNTLSHKDPRPDVHSLHTSNAMCGMQRAQGTVERCREAWPELRDELLDNGCTVHKVR